MATSIEEYKKQIKTANQASEDAEVLVSNQIHDTQSQNVSDSYTKQIDDTKQSYGDAFKANETQRFINARAIERRAAEMGLTDSGLNRTQQTAVQLSYANQKGKLERQQQSAIDTLAAAMNSELATISANKAASEQQIRSAYNEKADSGAIDLYNADQQRISDENIAAINAQKEIDLANIQAQQTANNSRYKFTGTTKMNDNGETVNVFIGPDGKEYAFAKGYNPYTSTNNNLTYKAEVAAGIGFFSNGYQPKGLVSEGGKFKATTINGGNVLTYNFKGQDQTIWQAPNRHYFYWDGSKNSYINADDLVADIRENNPSWKFDDIWGENQKITKQTVDDILNDKYKEFKVKK